MIYRLTSSNGCKDCNDGDDAAYRDCKNNVGADYDTDNGMQ